MHRACILRMVINYKDFNILLVRLLLPKRMIAKDNFGGICIQSERTDETPRILSGVHIILTARFALDELTTIIIFLLISIISGLATKSGYIGSLNMYLEP